MSTSVVIPAMRPHLLRALVKNIHAATPEPHTVHVVGTKRVLAPIQSHGNVTRWVDEGDTWGHRLNRVFDATDSEYFFCGADDVLFHRGWLRFALKAMEEVDGVVMVGDMLSVRGTLPLVSRNYINTMGGTVDGTGSVFHVGYAHNCTERELVETAEARGRYAYCEESIVEHRHFLNEKAPHDEVYAFGQSSWNADITLFGNRCHLWRH